MLWHFVSLSSLRDENETARPHADFAAWAPRYYHITRCVMLWHFVSLSSLRDENETARPHADFAAWAPKYARGTFA